jgi:UDP-N-acetyl-D-mannosaminuronate dehydrogenase
VILSFCISNRGVGVRSSGSIRCFANNGAEINEKVSQAFKKENANSDQSLEHEITVIGLGYVGLTTALSFAGAGIPVYGFEISDVKADSIRNGKVPFTEPGVSELLKKCLSNNSFEVGNSLKLSKISFLTIGTPSKKDGEIDLSYIKEASTML